jgi:hypothetical protein
VTDVEHYLFIWHCRWFYFRVTGVKEQFLSLNIVNAGDASYPEGWVGYDACCSYDRSTWFRVPTTYDSDTGILSIRHKPDHSSIYFAYFAPYSHDKHMRNVAEVQARHPPLFSVFVSVSVYSASSAVTWRTFWQGRLDAKYMEAVLAPVMPF